jgi:hypothetical protein
MKRLGKTLRKPEGRKKERNGIEEIRNKENFLGRARLSSIHFRKLLLTASLYVSVAM